MWLLSIVFALQLSLVDLTEGAAAQEAQQGQTAPTDLWQQRNVRITQRHGEGATTRRQQLLLRLQRGQIAPDAGAALLQ